MNGMSARDAAFLAEMGIGPLWQLRQTAEAPVQEAPWEEAEEVTAAPVQAQSPAAGQGTPTPGAEPAWVEEDVPATEPDISRMGWDELRAAIASCSRCSACRAGGKPVAGSGARTARWVVAAGATTSLDEKAGQPLAGDAGKLLDNMLHAVDLSRERDVYVTNLIKCRPASANGGDRAPTAEEAAACRPYLERELALTRAGTVLTLGQIAANALLDKPLSEPLAGARGSVHELAGVPLVATLHPGELLRRGPDKALAWADLCRARAADGRSG
ncbi:uracil-DNA glycosylase [Massilia horti]|uniref:Uracil-DNA glycosylase n=1 Tax=Massilia horti TaxID=2562153 RepID=A0A4Y9SVB0_9BURK|nr:uracil-DNA glycosylase [Massilia horti]TFW28686.1 uracil-DNA glycosylase [Massilia horti]